MRAELFKDIINDSDDEDEEKKRKRSQQKKIQPNYKIESIQYEGGLGTRSNSIDALSQYEGGDNDLYNTNTYMQMYHTRQEKGNKYQKLAS